MKNIFLMLMAAGLALNSSASAQEGRIQQRRENQQDRIANGVKNGTLTPHETARLENQQAKLNHEIRTDRKANGGNLTNNEKRHVNRQQNQLSKNIYKTKHDGPHQ
ncbi:MAG TPA: hypothetical protein VH157_05625 [Bryobacteraceae bacterium]|jgi:hypothetical protein|nr:hypothetical protein [Bryobacteraceae bacterium]